MSDTTDLPDTPEGVADLMAGLTFHLDREVQPGEVPLVPRDDEDALVPRSVKIRMGLDAALGQIAARRGGGVTKSDVMREFLEAGVAAELATQGEPVLIPLADALRALATLGHLPRSA